MRTRLLVVIVGVVAVVLAAFLVPLSSHLGQVERDRFNTRLERDAFILAGRAEETLEGDPVTSAALRSAVNRYHLEEDVRVVIVDADGVGVVGSDAAVAGQDFTNRPEFVTAIAGEPSVGERLSSTLGEDLFYVAVPVFSGEEVLGAVRLSAPEQSVADRVAEKKRGLAAVTLISLLIAIGAAWIVAGTISRPIRELKAATDRLADGDLSARAAPADGPPDVTALASSFNSMADRLESLIARQRSFAGTASHQLRTPLTALRLRLEQLAADAPEGTLDAALGETDRLHRMVEGLLALSRAEEVATSPITVDLASAARARVAEWDALAAELGVALSAEVPEVLWVSAAPGAVEQVIDNLVDNALEVSPTGSTVQVVGRSTPAGVELHVIDEGPGMGDEERAHAFDRFWRGRDAAPGGSGLGLAIVQQLAAAGGGTVRLDTAPGGGVDAVVSFRSATAP